MRINEVRRYALSLPAVTEEPHFNFSSFRVKGKIFTTVPPGDKHIHVFVEEELREQMIATEPQAYEKLWWGKRVVGLRVTLSRAKAGDVRELLQSAWQLRAPKSLVRSALEY